MINELKNKIIKIISKGSLISLSLMIMIIPQAALAASSLEMSGITKPEAMTVDAAKKGIVRVISGPETGDGNIEKKSVASGFIVSDSGNEIRVVTTLHAIDSGEDSKVQVAVKNGLAVDATVEKFPEKDFCILTVENKFNDKEMIPLRVPALDDEDSAISSGDPITVLGFPLSVGESSDYTDADVSMQSGSITKTAAENGGVLQFDATVTDGCDGGVVTDENGYAIGLVSGKDGKAMDITDVDMALYKEGSVYRSKDKDDMFIELYDLCDQAEKQYKRADKETKSEISRVYGVATKVLEEGPYDREALRSALDDYKGVAGNVKRSKTPLILIFLLGAVIVYLVVRLVSLIRWNKENGSGVTPATVSKAETAPGPGLMKKNFITERAENRTVTAQLVIYRTGATYAIGPHGCTLGKSADADISIPDNNRISRNHARIENINGAYYIYDNGSTNGTYLNNMPVGSDGMRLVSGDIIRLANEDVEFIIR